MDPSSIDGWNKIAFGEEDGERIGEWCLGLEPSAVERYSEVAKGPVVAQRSACPDPMHSCDLPPPLKIFAGPTRPTFPTYTTRKINGGREDDKLPTIEYLVPIVGQCIEEEKVNKKSDLLKALQLSQTRARAAERKACLVKRNMDVMTTLFLEESLRLFAHRLWVEVLELEVSQLLAEELYGSSFSYIENKLGRRCEEYS